MQASATNPDGLVVPKKTWCMTTFDMVLYSLYPPRYRTKTCSITAFGVTLCLVLPSNADEQMQNLQDIWMLEMEDWLEATSRVLDLFCVGDAFCRTLWFYFVLVSIVSNNNNILHTKCFYFSTTILKSTKIEEKAGLDG